MHTSVGLMMCERDVDLRDRRGTLAFHGGMKWSWPIAACVFASGIIHLAYSLVLQRAYQAADLSVVYPVARGTGVAVGDRRDPDPRRTADAS